jgi:hypothetical protein
MTRRVLTDASAGSIDGRHFGAPVARTSSSQTLTSTTGRPERQVQQSTSPVGSPKWFGQSSAVFQECEAFMIGPDQDLSQFPRWIWPYIRTADLARSRIFAASEQAQVEPVPQAVVFGHFAGLVQAVQLKLLAADLKSSVPELATAAGKIIGAAIDDFCGTKAGPHPPPPHRAAELATYVAAFAASSNNERLRAELAGVVEQISARAAANR